MISPLNARVARGRSGLDTRSSHTKDLKNSTCYFPALYSVGKDMRVKHTVLPDGQPSTATFTVLAQLSRPKANEAEMGAALLTKNGERRKFDFEFDDLSQFSINFHGIFH